MGTSKFVRLACISAAALLAGAALTDDANAGSFGVREQSAYFQGMSFAGTAAGGDISSMFWNSAATATLPGFNTSSNATIAFGDADLTATGGSLYGLVPDHAANNGTDALIPASYASYQLSDRLWAGLAMNAPFGFITKPDSYWSGSGVAETSKIFSLNLNPTLAYKITPTLTVGAGAQVEYFKIRLTKDAVSANLGQQLGEQAITPWRSYEADDWGIGATAGILWQPTSRTSIGLGYRSAVSLEVEGSYKTSAYREPTLGYAPVDSVRATATGKLTLPDEVTFSIRQGLTDRLTMLGTVEWQGWSRIDNVAAVSSGCANNVCETLNLNYQDGWKYALGFEYLYSPTLTLRTGASYEVSPIDDKNRNILIPDSDRIGVSVGATYKYSDRITVDFAYSHLFFDEGTFCIANPKLNGNTSHCSDATIAQAKSLIGTTDVAVDLVSVGLKYKWSDPVPALEPYK
ncbi:membrane protein involved in aromatic hydrocarbon degradation [Rhodomicrobium vannielii ATCC 17100]|uniref:Membrane protein involved in aromatic hydrocarbon degradation n=1 Tax=Rhodomicrobium vannielii (strain ATCC 17100 / DSM 162 / LMG 4299 / NCIMB 10020 / ATH 3.1.1) TaxID=648757 RepID=E3I2K7_RHOVT|nr:outer membrane protein transport protein [Rhodomicrobium vannielii]ADP71366.1 membrane protein involved in aromatic hydrocarbon degradation [Rhodomicrobium vannielii ATCC 17100]